uniref:Putative secreted protein n=1 Tax=Ornithodoros turicata TaxID=34597 RepID=A0A2R5L4J8_9ACAR
MKTWQALCLAVGLYGALFIATAQEEERNSKGQLVLHKCNDSYVLEKEHRNNISAFPADCRYYCNRSHDAKEIWYGYYEEFTPCTVSTASFTCATNGALPRRPRTDSNYPSLRSGVRVNLHKLELLRRTSEQVR